MSEVKITERVVIVQPYLPAYRVPLFQAVVDILASDSVDCVVTASAPSGEQRARGDAVTSPAWLRELPIRELRLAGRWIRTYRSGAITQGADAVVCELAAGAIDTYRLLGRKTRPVGVMGHVGSYVARDSRLVRAGETWQLRKADHVFAYTERGRDSAIQRGVAPDRVTAFLNTVDTAELRTATLRLTDGEIEAFRRQHSLGEGPVVAYIGGLDRSKRVDFLARALDLLWQRMPELRVLVGGSGPDVSLLEPAKRRGQAVLLGRVGAQEKAYIASVSSLLLNPGRVGLIAVDSFALGLPIVTLESRFHAPEFDYLSPGHDCVVTKDDDQAFVDEVVHLLISNEQLSHLRDGTRMHHGELRLEESAWRLSAGIKSLLAIGRSSPQSRAGRTRMPMATRGPAATWFSNLAAPYRLPVWERLSRDVGLDVRVFSVTEPGRAWEWPTPSGYSLELLPTRSVQVRGRVFYWLPGRSLRALPRMGVVVLPGWEHPAAWQIRRWARGTGAATVAFYESTDTSHTFRSGPISWARSRFMRGAGSVLTVGSASRAAVIQMGVPESRVVTGFNPVDVSWFATAADTFRSRPDADGHDGHDFLYVGQLISRKNVAALIDAFAMMSGPEDRLTIAGGGPLRESLERQVAAARCAGTVRFIGHVEHETLPEIYGAADTLVLPSTEEVWGLVANEALASGLQVVVSDRCGVAESIAGMPAVTIAAPDKDSLAAAMAASRQSWHGPVPDHPILAKTPEALAHSVLKAMQIALAQPAPGRRTLASVLRLRRIPRLNP